MKTTKITNEMNIIHSSNITKRIEELSDYLKSEYDAYYNSIEPGEEVWEFQWWLEAGANKVYSIVVKDYVNEYLKLKELQVQYETNVEWEYGANLIRETHWVDFIEQYCKEQGYLSDDCPNFINDCINWHSVAKHFAQDYIKVYFYGIGYFIKKP